MKQALERREQARKLLAAGIDPGAQRKAAKAIGEAGSAGAFEVIARAWFAKQKTHRLPAMRTR